VPDLVWAPLEIWESPRSHKKTNKQPKKKNKKQKNLPTPSISEIGMLLPWNKEPVGCEVRRRSKKEKTKQNKTLVLHGTSQSEEHAQI
jgi:DNA-nicking Smr family endonuclease